MWNPLFKIDLKYVPIKLVGRGSYGVVCSSINRETNERVAIMNISNTFDNPISALRTLRELKLLRKIQHRNVIALKGVMMPSHRSGFKDVYMVYELMDTDLSVARGAEIYAFRQCSSRDLKPGNLLVNSNGDLKICDFGLARTKQEHSEFMTKHVGARWYRAPELLLGCDIYGISIDMCQQEEDFEFIKSPKAKGYIKSLSFLKAVDFSRCYPSADPLAVDLSQKMLVFNPTKRISAMEALEHPYTRELGDPKDYPLAHPTIDLDVDEKVGEDAIREMILKEMLYYRPEASSS